MLYPAELRVLTNEIIYLNHHHSVGNRQSMEYHAWAALVPLQNTLNDSPSNQRTSRLNKRSRQNYIAERIRLQISGKHEKYSELQQLLVSRFPRMPKGFP